MKSLLRYIAGTCALLTLLNSCDGWIDRASTPNDTLTRQELDRAGMLATLRNKKLVDGPLTAYVKTVAGQAASASFVALGAMADEVSHTKVPNTLLYKELKNDNIRANSGQADGLWNTLQNLRARSEELLAVEEALTDDGTEGLDAVRAYARYTGHLYAGYACQLLADCFSADPSTSGTLRIGDRLVPHAEVYSLARTHYTKALEQAQRPALKEQTGSYGADLVRIAHTMLTKLAIHRADYAQAAAHLPQALTTGEAITIIYNQNGAENGLYGILGLTARDAEIDQALVDALRNDAERKAVPTQINKEKNRYLTSIERYSPLVIADYDEMQLIRAELIVRGELQGDAREAVNTVVGRFDNSSLETVAPDLATIAHLRRVYLLLRGERTADLRRNLVGGNPQSVWHARKNKWIPLPELEQ